MAHAHPPVVSFPHGATVKVPLRTPWDLTGYTISSAIKEDFGLGRTIASFTSAIQTNPQTGLAGLIVLTLSANVSAASFVPGQGDYAFNVKLIAPNNDVSFIPTPGFIALVFTPT